MSLSHQLAEFNAYAHDIATREGDAGSLEDVYDRWMAKKRQAEDLAAIRASVRDFENGERGEDAFEELQQFRAERAKSQQ